VDLVARGDKTPAGALSSIEEVLADLLLAFRAGDLAHGFRAVWLEPLHFLDED